MNARKKITILLLAVWMILSTALYFGCKKEEETSPSTPKGEQQSQMKDESLSGLQGKQIAEYNYNYWYLGTTVTHNIKEYYHQEKGIRMVVLEKETRKGDFFVKLPHSLWITKDGYPPLVTDAALKNPMGMTTLYFGGLPTVQSQEHIKIFDDTLRKELKEMGLDYDQLSKEIKGGELIKNLPITGFIYVKEGTSDPEIQKEFEKRVLKAYAQVLKSKPHRCPISLFVDEILGPTTLREYHLFKNEGFDVPFSGQKAFFTMMMDFRVPPDEEGTDKN
jgi:hypothetical protein